MNRPDASKGTVTAVEMARSVRVDPKRFRGALRRAGLRWHAHNDRWEVPFGGQQHQDMRRVLDGLTAAPRV